MKKYLLDSNIVSEPSKPLPNDNVLKLLKKHQSESAIATVTYFEMLHGVLTLLDGKRKERLKSFLDEAVCPFYDFLSYDFNSSKLHAEVLAKLESVGRPLSYRDSQIAMIALANDLTLVTRNVKDFKEIKKFFPLKIENWFEENCNKTKL